MPRKATFGRLLMGIGLGLPLLGLWFALTASGIASDYDVLTIELSALACGFILFQMGRTMAAGRED